MPGPRAPCGSGGECSCPPFALHPTRTWLCLLRGEGLLRSMVWEGRGLLLWPWWSGWWWLPAACCPRAATTGGDSSEGGLLLLACMLEALELGALGVSKGLSELAGTSIWRMGRGTGGGSGAAVDVDGRCCAAKAGGDGRGVVEAVRADSCPELEVPGGPVEADWLKLEKHMSEGSSPRDGARGVEVRGPAPAPPRSARLAERLASCGARRPLPWRLVGLELGLELLLATGSGGGGQGPAGAPGGGGGRAGGHKHASCGRACVRMGMLGVLWPPSLHAGNGRQAVQPTCKGCTVWGVCSGPRHAIRHAGHACALRGCAALGAGLLLPHIVVVGATGAAGGCAPHVGVR